MIITLEPGEKILLQTSEGGVHFCGGEEDGTEIDDLCLTNLDLIYTYEDSTGGIFSKSKDVVERIPLDIIEVTDGIPQVQYAKDTNYSWSLQICRKDGICDFFWINGPKKKIYPQWVSAIKDAVATYAESHQEELDVKEPTKEEPNIKNETMPANPEEPQKYSIPKAAIRCAKCGEENDIKARFCQECGALLHKENVESSKMNDTQTESKAEPPRKSPSLEYVKQKQKATSNIQETQLCINCGTLVKTGLDFCPKCGVKISGLKRDGIKPGCEQSVQKKCHKCGESMPNDASYCFKCGCQLTNERNNNSESFTTAKSKSAEFNSREQVYAGVIKKCPVCGEELPSMAAICPACGHEINSSQVHPILQKFIEDLDFCDQSIAGEETLDSINEGSKSERGWRSWSTVAKTLWVIVNCFTICVPLVVYLLFQSRGSQKAVPSIKRKANLIENYQIPSERQAIIESLYFIRDKVSALATHKITSDSVYWTKLWEVKAGQIYQKAKSAIPDDAIVLGLYHEINSSVQRVKTISKRKNIFACVIAIVYIFIIVAVETYLFNLISKVASIPNIPNFLPILWGFCAALLVAFFIWTLRKIPNSTKVGLTVAICIVALVCSVKSCQNNVADFTTQISDKCLENNMTLVDMDMNELTKSASIEVQVTTYNKSTVDDAEADFFAIAREHKFELAVSFVDEDNFSIRKSQIDEYGVIQHSHDNSNGIIEFVKEKCLENEAKLVDVYNSYGETIKFQIQVPTANSEIVMENLQTEIFAERTRFGYVGCILEFRTLDKYYGDLIRRIEKNADGSISLGERISIFNRTTIERIVSSARQKCMEQIINMDIVITDDDNKIVWVSYIDSLGEQANIDVYNFRIAVQAICDNEGVELEDIYNTGKVLSVTVNTTTRRKGKIDTIENKIFDSYNSYSDLLELTIHFRNPNEELEKRTIRDTRIDSAGKITYENDNTTFI